MLRKIWIGLLALMVATPVVQVVMDGFKNKEAVILTCFICTVGIAGIFLRNTVVPKEKTVKLKPSCF